MPFNMTLLSGGRRTFILSISAEDLSANYIVETEVFNAYGVNTGANDLVILNIANVNIVAANTSVYAIDGDTLHDSAELHIVFTSGAYVSGRGGIGGSGGDGELDPEPPPTDYSTPGGNGANGGTAIRYGCPTVLKGTGTVIMGYAGGGGAGGSPSGGGGGGGGGAALGAGGSGGQHVTGPNNGDDGATATVTAGGAGGATVATGGDGGDSGGAATNGAAGTGGAGLAGSNGDAINTQTFSHTAEGGITITGAVV